MHAFHTHFFIGQDGFCVSQYMRFTRLSASIATAFAFSSYRVTIHAFHTHVCIGQDGFSVFLRMVSQYMRFTCVFALVKTFAFSFVWRYNVCVSHACLHRLRRLLRSPSYRVTMHAFHTRVYIGVDVFYVFLRMALQCMRLTFMFASVKTTFAFFFLVSHACLHRLDGFCVFLRMALRCMRFTCVFA